MKTHIPKSVDNTQKKGKRKGASLMPPPIQRKANQTGMPDQLKSGVESLSGIEMGDVKVHYNSSQPAQLNAHAYAQGNQIHIAPGQEKHLPHEAWHVVQQKQGRVKPTMQLKGKVNINDDVGLEREADVMGGIANKNTRDSGLEAKIKAVKTRGGPLTAQRVIKTKNQSNQDPLPAKFTNAIANFINIVQANDSLSFLSTLPDHKLRMEITIYDYIPRAEGYTDIKIKGNGRVKTPFKSAGADLGALKDLLAKGTPKTINIEIAINYNVLNSESEAYIASVLAHEVGTHLAPYAMVIKKVAEDKKLNSGEIATIETAHGTDHEQVDHKALHNGYLKANWSPFYQKPMYRELIEALAKTHYSSPDAFREIWDAYTKDVSRYDMSTGQPDAKNKSSQLTFYTEYENYRQGKIGLYPVLKKMAANKGFTVTVLIGLLLIVYLMVLGVVNIFAKGDK